MSKTVYSYVAGREVPVRNIKLMTDEQYKAEADRQAKRHPEMYARAMKDAEEMRKDFINIPVYPAGEEKLL